MMGRIGGWLLLMLGVGAVLSACASYHPQADDPTLQGPAPFPTDSDRRALAPYANSRYFPDRP